MSRLYSAMSMGNLERRQKRTKKTLNKYVNWEKVAEARAKETRVAKEDIMNEFRKNGYI